MPGVHGFLVRPVTKRGIAGHRQAHARVLDYSVGSIGFNPCYSITSTVFLYLYYNNSLNTADFIGSEQAKMGKHCSRSIYRTLQTCVLAKADAMLTLRWPCNCPRLVLRAYHHARSHGRTLFWLPGSFSLHLSKGRQLTGAGHEDSMLTV